MNSRILANDPGFRELEEHSRRLQQRERELQALVRVVYSLVRLEEALGEVAAFVERQFPELTCAVRVQSAGQPKVSLGPRASLELVECFSSGPLECKDLPAGVQDPSRPLHHGAIAAGPAGCIYASLDIESPLAFRLALPVASASGATMGVLDVLASKPISDDEDLLRLAAMAADLVAIAVDQRERRAQLAFQSRTDALTKLPNRFEFKALLERMITHAAARDSTVGLLLLNVDRFKEVNDSYGHSVGDSLLCTIGQRLHESLPPDSTIGRFGGDEFAIAVHGINGSQGLGDVATRLIQALRRPIRVGDITVVMGATVGAAAYPGDGVDTRDLIRAAGSALHQAKRSDRGGYRCYKATPQKKGLNRIELETSLREALASGGLELNLQPQIDSQSDTPVGMELLARWTHPQHGPIPPSTFIPLAEESTLIDEIGAWVLDAAAEVIRRWHESGGPPLRWGINVSPHQLLRLDFPGLVRSRLLGRGVLANEVEFEITESALIEDFERFAPRLQELREMGFRVSLDDFGTGYSSLAYLLHLPVDRVKIDRAFVTGLDRGPQNVRLLEGIVRIAHMLNLEVVAEGVEEQEQLEILQKAGCNIVQGYLFHRPMSVDDAMERFTGTV